LIKSNNIYIYIALSLHTEQEEVEDESIGQPFNIKHHIHVELDVDGVGYKGLPQEWQDKLKVTTTTSLKQQRTMKIVERPDSLFVHSEHQINKQRTKRESRQLHLSTSRKSSLKANVLKAVQVIQDQERGLSLSLYIYMKGVFIYLSLSLL
jgi:hypothetical protein